MSIIDEAALHAIPGLDLLHSTLVRVSVRDLRLRAYPMRHGEVVIHHVAPEHVPLASPVKPHQILFVIDAIPAGHSVTLLPSEHNVVHLSGLDGPRSFHGPGVTLFESGVPDRGPGHHHELVWEYDIELRDAHGGLVDRIDPPVIIKEDP